MNIQAVTLEQCQPALPRSADSASSVAVFDMCSSKACLAVHYPKYKCSIPLLLFQFSSYPFNFTFISCLYTGSFFPFFFHHLTKTIIYLALSLPPALSESLGPPWLYLSFILTSFKLFSSSLALSLSVYRSLCPPYSPNHCRFWHLRPPITGRGPNCVCICLCVSVKPYL